FIRAHPEEVRRAVELKRIEFDVDELLAVDAERRRLIRTTDELKAKQNRTSKQIATLQGDERTQRIREMQKLVADIKRMDQELKQHEAEFERLMLHVPNIPAAEVPAGEDESENVELRRWGTPPTFDFEFRDHVALGLQLDIMDFERASKLAGSRTYFLKGAGALLEMAVLRLALDHIQERGFVPMLVPHLVRPLAMIGTAYYPGGEEQAYRVERDNVSLIGTSEVPLTSYHASEILDEAELPKLYAGWSVCFRREAGTHGKDTRGLYRIHQFQKIEQVVICRADEEESRRWHQTILQNAEDILQMLELPYRVVNVCGGDLGRPQIQKFDLETWMPSRQSYSETHSASRFHDYQSRRLDMRYRGSDGKLHFCHTLNNTVIASPRILIPILENNQLRDGSLVVPPALRPYMNGLEKLERS
ncbi:MAG: serine--tRNA ligase, partial [Candidatus Krumholzibacteriia bacterium]